MRRSLAQQLNFSVIPVTQALQEVQLDIVQPYPRPATQWRIQGVGASPPLKPTKVAFLP